MSHTNSTANYSLPQFISSDKPGWLTDVNAGYSTIDTAIKGASDAATAVDTKVGSLAGLNTPVKTSIVNAINSINADTDYTDPNGKFTVRQYGNIVYIRLEAIMDVSAGAWTTIGNIPQQFRPQQYVYNVIWDNSANASDMFRRGRVNTNGNLQVLSATAGSNRTIEGEFTYIL